MQERVPIGVLGAGTMGAGIAQIAATAGHPVSVFDTSAEALKRAASGLDRILARLTEKGRLTRESAESIRHHIDFTTEISRLSSSAFVIEAIVEDLAVKSAAFSGLEDKVPANCILATNTSSLSVTAIAASCRLPERVVGMHFFNPAPLLPLVEVVPALTSSEETSRTAFALARSWGKTPVLVRDTPGFIVNRVARPFYGESLRMLEEGIADAATIDWALREHGGFKMGPFELMDLIGNDINAKVTETVFAEFFYDPRYRPSFTQKRMVEAGWLGRKSGRGFFDYSDGAATPAPVQDQTLARSIVERVRVMLINEAADALFLRIATPEDIDLAMTKGVNYPKGLLAWGDEIGWKSLLEQMEALQREYGEDRYRPSPLMRKLAREGREIYG